MEWNPRVPSLRPSWTAPQTIWLAVVAAVLPWLPFPSPVPVPARDPSRDARPPGSVFLYEETLEANGAAVEDFEALPGVGPATARRLVEARDERGGFCSAEEIREAGRLSARTWESVRTRVRLRPAASCATRVPAIRAGRSRGS